MKLAVRLLSVLLALLLVLPLTSCSFLAVLSTDIGNRKDHLLQHADGEKEEPEAPGGEERDPGENTLYKPDPNCDHRYSDWQYYDENYHCRTCSECHGSEIGTHENVTGENTATCTEGCDVVTSCSVCGHTETEHVDPLGHDWGPFSVDKPATETETGLRTHVCKRCSTPETEIIPVKSVLVPLDPALYYGKQFIGTKSETLQKLYAAFVTECEKLSDEITLPEGLTEEELSLVFSAYFYDHPEQFWVKDAYSVTTVSGTDELISVHPQYLFTAENLPAAKELFEAAVEKKLEGLDGLMSEFELELALHDRIVTDATYDKTYEAPCTHSAYGNLVLGTSVCDGYARTFQLLLNRCGIAATQINGTSRDEPHAWTAVCLGGDWYYVDVTWDDPTGSTLPGITHAYFNLTEEAFFADHTPNHDLPLPLCVKNDLNYYYVNGLEISDLTVTNVIGVSEKASLAGQSVAFEFAVSGGIPKADADAFFSSNVNQLCKGLTPFKGSSVKGLQWVVTGDRIIRVYPY